MNTTSDRCSVCGGRGRGPCPAAGNPALRPRLIELVKQHLKNMAMQNREKGMDFSIDWVLDELHLEELK